MRTARVWLRMYQLYYDHDRKPAGVFDTKASAMTKAQDLSRKTNTTLIGVYNKAGTSYLCFKYAKGTQTFDGGCCPNPIDLQPRA